MPTLRFFYDILSLKSIHIFSKSASGFLSLTKSESFRRNNRSSGLSTSGQYLDLGFSFVQYYEKCVPSSSGTYVSIDRHIFAFVILVKQSSTSDILYCLFRTVY